MNSELKRQIEQVWDIERSGYDPTFRQESQRANERAAAAGRMGGPVAAGILAKDLPPIVDSRGGQLIEGVRKVYAAHAIAVPEADASALVERFRTTITQRSVEAQAAIRRLKGPSAANLNDPSPQVLKAICARRLHEFEVMLTSFRHAAAKTAAQPIFSVNNSQNVQIGDHNVQVNYSAIFRDIIGKIEASPAPTVDKEAAKGFLSKFLEHPVTAAVIGGISGTVFGPK